MDALKDDDSGGWEDRKRAENVTGLGWLEGAGEAGRLVPRALKETGWKSERNAYGLQDTTSTKSGAGVEQRRIRFRMTCVVRASSFISLGHMQNSAPRVTLCSCAKDLYFEGF